MERRLYLLRHCASVLSQGHYCLGHTDVPLSDEGREAAYGLQKRFLDQGITAIYASELARSAETAQIIGQGLGLVPQLEVSLREIKMGQWDGLTFGEIKARFPEAYRERGENLAEYRVSGGESFVECAKRARLALNVIMAASQGDVLVVAHGGFNRAFLWDLAGRADDLLTRTQDYGCINTLVYKNEDYQVAEKGIKDDQSI